MNLCYYFTKQGWCVCVFIHLSIFFLKRQEKYVCLKKNETSIAISCVFLSKTKDILVNVKVNSEPKLLCLHKLFLQYT